MNLPEWLVLWVWNALIGEIYPEIRAIALQYDADRNLLLRYYFDRIPTEDDVESISLVITTIWANTSSDAEINTIEQEAIYSRELQGDLDVLDGLVYARREYSLKG